LTQVKTELLVAIFEKDYSSLEDWWFQETGKGNQSSYPKLNSSCTNTRANHKQAVRKFLGSGKRRRILAPIPQETVNI